MLKYNKFLLVSVNVIVCFDLPRKRHFSGLNSNVHAIVIRFS